MKTVWLSICLVLGMVLAWFGVQPPPPVSADAPSDRFSAARAFSDIRVIAEKPHPVGSRAHDAVKTYLTKRFSEMGFRPEVWNGVGIMAGQVYARPGHPALKKSLCRGFRTADKATGRRLIRRRVDRLASQVATQVV